MNQTIEQLAADVRHLTAKIPRAAVNPEVVQARNQVRRGKTLSVGGAPIPLSKLFVRMRMLEQRAENFQIRANDIAAECAALRALLEEKL